MLQSNDRLCRRVKNYIMKLRMTKGEGRSSH
jgi:hypothetical protein